MTENSYGAKFMSFYVWMLLIDRTGVKNPEERQPVNCVQKGTPTFSALCSEHKKRICLGIPICCETVKRRMH